MDMINTWEKLTLGKWQEIHAITNTDADNLDKTLEILKVLTSYDEATLLQLDLKVFNNLVKQMEFLQTPYVGKMKEVFTINGVEYKVNWRAEDKTTGQFIDITRLTEKKELINDNIHNILGVICLPEGQEYQGDYGSRAEFFQKNLTMDYVFPISNFFLKVWENSMPLIEDYLSQKLLKLTRKYGGAMAS